MTSFYYNYHNPWVCCFLVQIKAFVLSSSVGLTNLNNKAKPKWILVVVVKYRHRAIAILTNTIRALACKQALRGAQVLGREKEGGFATMSLEFEYLHWKSQCEMLISGDDVTLGTCFSIFVFIRACFCFTLIGRNLTAQSTGSHGGIGGGIQIPTT